MAVNRSQLQRRLVSRDSSGTMMCMDDGICPAKLDNLDDVMKMIGAAALLWLSARLVAAETVTLDNVDPPAEISADEPFAPAFSLEQAARSLDTAALDWQKTRACTACHTMLPYLMARPALSSISPQSAEVRHFFEEVAAGRREAMPAYSCKDLGGAVEVGIASALAMNDRQTTGKLHPLTRQALDRMW